MGVMVPIEPMRPSVYRGVLVAAGVGALLIAVIAVAASGGWWGLMLAPGIWCIAAFALAQTYRPEPALEEWDKIPRDVRLQMVRTGHPAAWTLGKYDRDWEIKALWSKTLRKGVIGG